MISMGRLFVLRSYSYGPPTTTPSHLPHCIQIEYYMISIMYLLICHVNYDSDDLSFEVFYKPVLAT